MNTEIDSTLDIQADLKARADAELVVAQAEQARQDAETEQRLQARFRENVHTFLSDRWDMPPEQVERITIDPEERSFTIGTWDFLWLDPGLPSLVTGLCPICGAPRATWGIQSLEQLAQALNDPDPTWRSTCECSVNATAPAAQVQPDDDVRWEYLTPEQREATTRLSEAILDLVATILP
jgi:hypothetical protein